MRTSTPWKFMLGLLGLLFVLACQDNSPSVPRPAGWPRIDLPPHDYQTVADLNCPFTFEFPAFGEVENRKPDSCWMDLYFKPFECRWHITYRHVPSSGKSIAEHNEEYRKLVFKHIQKVSQIKETPLASSNGSGLMYELFGTVGVPAQFYFTDSTHMVMASFYFDTAVRNDSLAPVIAYMKEDLVHMAQSIVWR